MTDSPPLDFSEFPVLDREGTLARLKDDKEFLLTLYQVYRDDLPGKLTAIAAALDENDLDRTQRSAHSLKGASATVGAAALREVAYALELSSRGGDEARSRQLAGLLAHQAELVLTEIAAALDQ